MGKANRIKTQKSSVLLGAQKKKKKEMPTWVGTLVVALVALLLVLMITFFALDAKGIFLRFYTYAESENYTITGPMMSYLIYSEYQTVVSNYGDYLSQLKGTGGSTLNTSMSLRSQYQSVTTNENGEEVAVTYFDYFANMAANDAKQILMYCEEAKKANITLGDEDIAEVNEAISAIETYASANSYDLDDYVTGMYGKGVKIKDIRAMMELSQLAAKYAEIKVDEIKAGVTKERIETYFNENYDEYNNCIDYLSYSFSTTFEKAEGEDAETKNIENKATYEAEQTKYKGRAEALAACADPASFKTLLLSYLREDALEDEIQKKREEKADAKNKELAAAGQEETAKPEDAEFDLTPEEMTACENAAGKTAGEQMENIETKNYTKSSNETDLDKWLYPAEGDRAVNDTNKAVTEEEAFKDEAYQEKVTSTYTVQMVTRARHVNDSFVHDVGHILFKSDTFNDLTDLSKLTGETKVLAQKVLERDGKVTAEAMAKELLAKMLADGKLTQKTREDNTTYYVIDKSVFEEYGGIYTEDSNVIYEAVYDGQMVKPFQAWLFDPARQQNEITYPDAVKTDYGYHIMTYLGNKKLHWYNSVEKKLQTDDEESFFKDLTASYEGAIEIKEKALNKVSG